VELISRTLRRSGEKLNGATRDDKRDSEKLPIFLFVPVYVTK